MFSKDTYYDMVKTAGAKVTITRPSTSATHTAYLAGSGTTREYAVSGDASQEGEDGVMSVMDFSYGDLSSPQKGDRITDADGSILSIAYVRKRYGVGRVLLGWLLRMVG